MHPVHGGWTLAVRPSAHTQAHARSVAAGRAWISGRTCMAAASAASCCRSTSASVCSAIMPATWRNTAKTSSGRKTQPHGQLPQRTPQILKPCYRQKRAHAVARAIGSSKILKPQAPMGLLCRECGAWRARACCQLQLSHDIHMQETRKGGWCIAWRARACCQEPAGEPCGAASSAESARVSPGENPAAQ